MKLVIEGEVPSKKNNRVFIKRGKAIVSMPNKKYSDWHTQALWQLKGANPVENYPIGITIVLYPKTKRKFDLDNRATSILDVLQDASIIEDDDWVHVDTLTVEYGGHEPNPRAEIWIDE